MIRKTVLTLALTAGMVAGAGGAASAHECFVADRSAQGNAAATHSDNWHTLTLADLYSSAHLFLQTGRPLSPAEVDAAVARAAEQGIPTSFTVFGRHMLPRSVEKMEELSSRTSDGKGVDHFFVAYGEDIIAIYFAIAFPQG
ncbi:MAG: hypothetical protein AVDCRST_MAG07-1291 [uncultured Frankineae bacterium]|uniref:Uncharacterized protein n=1 Tax=uncultured Frankineae bacterium TaxID=437475 RepID=A0A6J4L324_9ACTN|nr:MAG: hypothetical protein AVDCRST_MAG07-1291 [uncultured Frankineae bacterium]